jgi:HD-GYP domain-containing protein (c-di-GMP phosphodiesterase class II)
VWAKPGPLTRGEHEQIRLHAYHSERVLESCPALRPLARLAGSHGERSDGSGYHRGSRAVDLPAAAWLLAAADCYQAMREPRAYRPARSARAAADELARDTRAGKFPVEAAQAVLTAAGQPPRPVPRPAGLSEREGEVLALIARGMTTKQVARQLGISPKTCDHHIQRLYRKTGLSTRAGVTLFALEHGLIRPD